MTPRAEWRGRTTFVPFAEALGIAADHIIGVKGNENRPEDVTEWTVLYTKTTHDDPETPVYGAALRPDADRVLRLVGTPREVSTIGAFLPDLGDLTEGAGE